MRPPAVSPELVEGLVRIRKKPKARPRKWSRQCYRYRSTQVVYALSRSRGRRLYGHGPVYGVDDDNKVLPRLFDKLVRVSRVGEFSVGHIPSWDEYKVPIVNDLRFMTGTNSSWQRPIAFDYGGYTPRRCSVQSSLGRCFGPSAAWEVRRSVLSDLFRIFEMWSRCNPNPKRKSAICVAYAV